MITTFGQMPNKMPAGFAKAVSFPVLAMVDLATTDGRLLDSAGGGTRDLPLSIKYATKTSYGHDGAEVSGALFEVTLDPDNNKLSGRGFLLADDNGRRHARMIATGAMRGNSVDIADISARWEMDMDTYEETIRFVEWNLAATTGVATPAFAQAYAELLDTMSEEELTASFGDPMDPLVVELTADMMMTTLMPMQLATEPEITASAGTVLAPFAAFFTPEADAPQKIVLDENGYVFGHLAVWNSCHDGIEGQCVSVPRPRDGYASFNKPGVLTERGIVETGPIMAFGGHRPANGAVSLEDVYGGIENAWCDVRMTEGRFGPWISGFLRPGVADEVVYAARASRISGHWVAGKLKAIVSVNAEGFDVPGSGVPAFAFQTKGDTLLEMVASFPTCPDFAAPAAPPADDADAAEDTAEAPPVEVEVEVKVTVEVGADDDEAMECPDCGMQVDDGANYCPECGAQMPAAGAASSDPEGFTPSAEAMLLSLLAEE